LNLNESQYQLYKTVDDYFTYEKFMVSLVTSLIIVQTNKIIQFSGTKIKCVVGVFHRELEYVISGGVQDHIV
jgi:hypothetical protein